MRTTTTAQSIYNEAVLILTMFAKNKNRVVIDGEKRKLDDEMGFSFNLYLDAKGTTAFEITNLNPKDIIYKSKSKVKGNFIMTESSVDLKALTAALKELQKKSKHLLDTNMKQSLKKLNNLFKVVPELDEHIYYEMCVLARVPEADVAKVTWFKEALAKLSKNKEITDAQLKQALDIIKKTELKNVDLIYLNNALFNNSEF